MTTQGTGRIRAEDIAEVRARIRIDEVIGEHVALRAAGGGSLKGLCPFHDERSPSFHVTPAKGLYHCFGCQAGGDVIAFLINFQGYTFSEAVERLAERAGVQLRYEEGTTVPQREAGQRARLLLANRSAAAFYVEQLGSPQGRVARETMAQRGFDRQALEHFGVGYAPGGWQGLTDHLRSSRFDDETLLAAGLVVQGQRGPYDRFRNRLIWPIRDVSGDVVGFGARRLGDGDDGPKYLNTPETALYKKSQVLYGVDLARRTISRTQQVVVVEGYTDVMAAHLAGVTNAVATCGTAFGGDHISVLRRLLFDDAASRGEVVFTFDSDEAGRKAALRAFDSDHQFSSATFVAIEPSGLDPADLRLKQGDEAVRQLVSRRVPLYEYALRSAVDGVDLGTAEGRMAGLRRVAPIIAGIRDQALRPEYTRVAAGWLGLPEATVAAALRPARGARPRPGPAAGSFPSGLERDALRGILHMPEVAAPWLESIEQEAFDGQGYRDAFATIAAVGSPADEESEEVWLDRILNAAVDDDQRALLRRLAVEPMPVREEDAAARYVESLLARLIDRDAARRLDVITAQLARPGTSAEEGRALQKQYQAVALFRVQMKPMITSEVQ